MFVPLARCGSTQTICQPDKVLHRNFHMTPETLKQPPQHDSVSIGARYNAEDSHHVQYAMEIR